MTFPKMAPAVATMVFLASPACAGHVQRCNEHLYSMDDGHSVVCSNTWQFTGTCTGGDMWDQWTITGEPKTRGFLIKPWLHYPITVVGYELVKLQGVANFWFMIGSMIQPDAQLWLAPNETHSKQMWPAGSGQPFPSIEQANPAKREDVIDLHGGCPKGDKPTIMMTIYYNPPWDTESITAGKPSQ
jgi:hypothetical protein